MAHYAALLSVMHTLNQIKKHPRPPIFISPNQMESLDQNLTCLLNFLERHCGEEDEDLESRIAAAAYAAEDVIETHIVDRIHSGSDISTVGLYEGLEKAIRDLNIIKKEVMEEEIIKEMKGVRIHDTMIFRNTSVRRASTRQSNAVVEIDDVLVNEVLDKLTGHQSYFKVIPIVGMGGIGKTSFAQYIYTNPLIVEHFYIRIWVTISQEYNVSEILSQVLSDKSKGMSEYELGVKVHKKLWGRRYLIVMDDIWAVEAWDQVKSFFPDDNNGSRVMITTRLSKLAFDISGSRVFQMNFLDEDKSWALFCKTVFGKEGCPIVLEDIAKKIVRNCRGLPLSIVVIGGVLKNSNMTQTYWEYILEDLSSTINLEDDGYCLQLLRTSYKELPIHLKSCFMYMGIFCEDAEIRVSELIILWVAEGILRPTEGRRLEEVAEECIMELVDRNLISVYKLCWKGEVKSCKVHDLLRDLCLREGKKQRFLCTIKDQRDLMNVSQYINMERRICISDQIRKDCFCQLESASLTRSFNLQGPSLANFLSLSYRLLRVLTGAYWGLLESSHHLDSIFQNVNMRHFTLGCIFSTLYEFPSSWALLWNLQSIKVEKLDSFVRITVPSEVWEMVLLRHVNIINVQLLGPPCGENDFILQDLQTLSCVINFRFSNTVIKRIQNIRILKLRYEISLGETEYHMFYVNNLYHLKNLTSLNITLCITEQFAEEFGRYMGQNLNFPHSLKKLTLSGNMFKWEECRTNIGLLPFLEYLKLYWDVNCGEPEWETVEGQFCNLKFLHLFYCYGLRYWKTDNTHFPRLEHLVLECLAALEEIPSSIGDIPTLKSILLDCCSRSVVESAIILRELQIELGNVDLQLIIEDTLEEKWAEEIEEYIEEEEEEEEEWAEEIEEYVEEEEEEEEEEWAEEIEEYVEEEEEEEEEWAEEIEEYVEEEEEEDTL